MKNNPENIIRITLNPSMDWFVSQNVSTGHVAVGLDPGRLAIFRRDHDLVSQVASYNIVVDMKFPEEIEWSWWQESDGLCIRIHEISAIQRSND